MIRRTSIAATPLVRSFSGAIALFAWVALPGCFGTLFGDAPRPADEELLHNVEQIRQAQLELLVVDDFVPCGTEAQAHTRASETATAWASEPCWARIGWGPDEPVRGGYWVEVSADGQDFTVHGVAPTVQGTLHVTATRGEPAATSSE